MSAAADDRMLLRVRDLAVDFRVDRGQAVPAVRGISFDLPAESTVALVGESGSGKSVTALAILQLLPPNGVIRTGSAIEYDGRDLIAALPHEMRSLRGEGISMIFQEPMSSLNPVFTVGFQLCEVLAGSREVSPSHANPVCPGSPARPAADAQ